MRLVESQRDLLIRALQELYQRAITGRSIKRIANDQPFSVNEILDNLGIYKQANDDSSKTPLAPLQGTECTEMEDSSKHLHLGTFDRNIEVQSCPDRWCENTSSIFSDFVHLPSPLALSPSLLSPSPPYCQTYLSSVFTQDVRTSFQTNRPSCVVAEGVSTKEGNISSPWAKYRMALNAPDSALYEPLGTEF